MYPVIANIYGPGKERELIGVLISSRIEMANP
jgi:hypothetical protein